MWLKTNQTTVSDMATLWLVVFPNGLCAVGHLADGLPGEAKLCRAHSALRVKEEMLKAKDEDWRHN